jgi:hypothetical protein
MKKIFNITLITTAILLGFFYPKGQPFYGLTKIFAFAVLIYFVLKLSQRIKSKNDEDEI